MSCLILNFLNAQCYNGTEMGTAVFCGAREAAEGLFKLRKHRFPYSILNSGDPDGLFGSAPGTEPRRSTSVSIAQEGANNLASSPVLTVGSDVPHGICLMVVAKAASRLRTERVFHW